MGGVDELSAAHTVTGLLPLLQMTPRLGAVAKPLVQPQEPLSIGVRHPLPCPCL